MKKTLEQYLQFNSGLTKVKAAKGGVISHRKIIYTDHEINSAKKVLNNIIVSTSKNEVIKIKAKVLIIQENGDE